MPDIRPGVRRLFSFALRRPKNAGSDAEAEWQSIVDQHVAYLVARGAAPEQARAEALRVAGSLDDVRSSAKRRERRLAFIDWLEDARSDARFALRSLRRAPGFAATAVGTIALGIGATTAIFSVVDALLIRPLPYPQPERLVRPWGWSLGEYVGELSRTRSYASLAYYRTRSATVDDGTRAEHLDGADASVNLFATMGVAPELGTAFPPNANDKGRTDAVVLSHAMWQQWFGGSPRVLGTRVSIDGVPHTVLGVMPPAFQFPGQTIAFWTPIEIERGNRVNLWAFGGCCLVGRLRPGVTVAQANAELHAIAPTMRHDNTLWDPGPDYAKDASVKPLQTSMVASSRPVLYVLAGSALLVLLIACVNVANLLLARATARERELSVRAAVGGERGRLIRQLLTESLTLSLVGSVFGAALAFLGVRWLAAHVPAGVPRAAEIATNGTVLAFCAVASLLSGVAFGLLPAWRATTAAPGLRVRGQSQSRDHHRVASALIVSELAFAVLLVICAELLVRSFAALRGVDAGFSATHVLSAEIDPPPAQYTAATQFGVGRLQRLDGFYARVLDQLHAMPGVEHAALIDKLPLAGPEFGIALRVQGQHEDVTHGLPMADNFHLITPEYLAALGVPLLQGRNIGVEDRQGAPLVALVSESMAKSFWPHEDALGKHIGYPFPGEWITVVGVVGNVKQDSLSDTATKAVYIPFAQRLGSNGVSMTAVVRVRAQGGAVEDARAFGDAVTRIVDDIDRGIAVTNPRTLDDIVSHSLDKPRFTLLLVSGFALAALLLGLVGVHGVLSYLVSQRTHEMGVRIALGATPRDILGLILGRGAVLAMGGAAIGIVAALVTTRFLRTLLYGVVPNDPLTFVSAAALFIGAALAAGLGPARRAFRVDPIEALRAE